VPDASVAPVKVVVAALAEFAVISVEPEILVHA